MALVLQHPGRVELHSSGNVNSPALKMKTSAVLHWKKKKKIKLFKLEFFHNVLEDQLVDSLLVPTKKPNIPHSLHVEQLVSSKEHQPSLFNSFKKATCWNSFSHLE